MPGRRKNNIINSTTTSNGNTASITKSSKQQQGKFQSESTCPSEAASTASVSVNNLNEEQEDFLIQQFLRLQHQQQSSVDASIMLATTTNATTTVGGTTTTTSNSAATASSSSCAMRKRKSRQQQQQLQEQQQHRVTENHHNIITPSTTTTTTTTTPSPFVGRTSDKLRRVVWPILLRRTADAHLSATLRKKHKKKIAASVLLSSSSTASASSSSTSSSTIPSLMSIEDCDLRLEAFHRFQNEQNQKHPKHNHHLQEDTITNCGDFPFPKRCSAHVVEADVNRSLFDFPSTCSLLLPQHEGEGGGDEEATNAYKNHAHDLDIDGGKEQHQPDSVNLRSVMRTVLKRTLLRVCAADPSLHYYQGLHDIASVVLHVYFDHKIPQILHLHLHLHRAGSPACLNSLEDRMAETFLELTRSRLRRFCGASMLDTAELLIAMHGVLQKVSPRLARQLERSGIGPTWNFALSWLITWFGHDLDHFHANTGNPHLGVETNSKSSNCASVTNSVLRVIYDFLIRTNENMIAFLCISVLVNFCRVPSTPPSPPSPRHHHHHHHHQESPKTRRTTKKKANVDASELFFDEQQFGKLIPDVEALDRSVLGDFGMLHSHLKKLPHKLLCDGDERKALEQLDMLIETASRLEKAHKGFLLYLLDDPMNRVIVSMPNLDFESDDDEEAEGDEIDEGTAVATSTHWDETSLTKKPLTTTFSNGLRMFMLLGVVASAAVAQVFMDPQRFGL